jgi:hypothetical protein
MKTGFLVHWYVTWVVTTVSANQAVVTRGCRLLNQACKYTFQPI